MTATKWATLIALATVLCIPAIADEQGAAKPAGEQELPEGWTSLFSGTDLTGWQNARNPGAENKWSVEDGAMTNVDHGNDIATIETFKDFALHIEYKTLPGGNSGVYLRGRVEVQVLDSHGKKPEDLNKGDAGAVYDQYAPLKNAAKPAGEWHTVDIIYCGDLLTVTLNGERVQDSVRISEPTGGALPGGVNEPGPLMLQGDHGKVWYRNIRVKPLTDEDCIKQALTVFGEAMQTRDLNKLGLCVAEDFYSYDWGNKEGTLLFVKENFVMGHLDGARVDAARAGFDKTDDAIVVYPVVLSAAFGTVSQEFVFKKQDDGAWRMSRIMVEGL